MSPTNVSLLLFSLLIGAQSSDFGVSSMPPTILTLQMIIDFAVDKNWKRVVFFDCIGSNDCTRPYAKALLDCLFKHGILTSIKSLSETTNLPEMLRVDEERLGVVVLLDDVDLTAEDNLIHKLMEHNKSSRAEIVGEFVAWLLLSTKWNSTQIFEAARQWPIGVDSDVTVAMTFLSTDAILTVLRQFSNRTCENLQTYGRRYDYKRLRRSQSVAPPELEFVQDTEDASKTIIVFYLVSVFKIRLVGNDSLEFQNWNSWTPSRRFALRNSNSPKHRNDLKNHTMNFGLQNSSQFYEEDETASEIMSDLHASSVETLQELISLLQICLNVRANTTSYVFSETAQVTKENNDLVHAITSGEIDVGAANIDSDLERNNMLVFSYPIAFFYRNIYFTSPETSSNIFLRPFSNRLLMCVIGTLALIVAVMEAINYVTLFIHWKEDKAHFGLGEATLWCFSIICMQGSPWTPRTRAGKTVLLCSLFFALIVYNSYSGFITSILSTKNNGIGNYTDLFEYGYTFGCSKNDDHYLMSSPDLRSFYMKALQSNELKVSEKAGLEKTINDKYAFFVTETVAKRILRSTSLMFHRCSITELRTKSQGRLALPMSDDSPYKKIINVSILRMWQFGILGKLSHMLKPPLIDCDTLTYKQAHIADVYGAFCILGVGVAASVLVLFLERAWANRQSLRGIQRRFAARTHHHRHRPTRPQGMVDTARLPMRILGLDREIREVKEKPEKNGEEEDKAELKTTGVRLLFSKSKKRKDQIPAQDHVDQPQTFPFCL